MANPITPDMKPSKAGFLTVRAYISDSTAERIGSAALAQVGQ